MKPANSLVLLLSTMTITLVVGQTSGQVLTADLERYYFASSKAEIAARAELESALQRLQRFRGEPMTGTRLLHELQAYEQAQKIYRRHDSYLRFRCSLNRKDPACDAKQGLESEVSAKTAFVPAQILGLSSGRLRALYAAEPDLRPYKFAIEAIRRDSGHVLPADMEALLGQFQPEIADWQYELYGQIMAGISFGTVQTQSGVLDVIRQRSALASSPDARVREEGFKRRFNGYASQRDLLAFALVHTVKAQNSLAHAHHYQDAPARKYGSLYLDPVRTRALLNEMAREGNFAKRFEKIRARDFEEANKTPMQVWDLSAPEPDFAPPSTPLVDAPRIFHAAFAGLSPEYQSAFDALLGPGNGRADVLPGGARDRYTGGFSIGFSGSTSMLFVGRYDGTFKDLSVIAHEGGHAVHRSLMDANGVRPLYTDGPAFLFESFAAFNELVLADYMAEHAADSRLRRHYRERWLGIKGLDTFYGAQDALLEQKIYEGVSEGSIRGADDLDKLTEVVDGQFSVFPGNTPELRNRWAAVSLMYEDPLYDVNYVYGGLLALKYYQLYLIDHAQFVPRYVALLKNGFNAPPAVLLKRFLNIDLLDSSLLADDLELLNQRLSELESPQ